MAGGSADSVIAHRCAPARRLAGVACALSIISRSRDRPLCWTVDSAHPYVPKDFTLAEPLR